MLSFYHRLLQCAAVDRDQDQTPHGVAGGQTEEDSDIVQGSKVPETLSNGKTCWSSSF